MVRALADPAVHRVGYLRARVGLGDLLCTVPALRALRAARPDVRVSLITWAEMAPVVDRFAAYVDELLPFPGFTGIPDRPAEPDRLPEFLRAAADRRFDLVVQGYGDRPAANELVELVPARRHGGFVAAGHPGGDPATYLSYPRNLHEVHRHLRLVEHLGVPPGSDALEFPTSPDEHVAWAELAAAEGLRRGEFAVLHPGASSPSRWWPAERFAAVADGLHRRGLRVVVTGVRGEEAITAEVRRRAWVPVVDLTARTPLGVFACLLAAAALLVVNDTGAAHLAVATGTPSVTVFLAGDPVRWAYRDPRHRIARAGVPCSPCPYLECPIDFRCAHRLPAEAVLAQADALLA